MPNNPLSEISMLITKASVQPDGSIRWQAVTSDTSPDNYNEATSLQLFQDWIERANTGVTVDWLPPPRKPFLGVSHYSDLDGFGEAGITNEMWVQGDRFKAGGNSKDGPVGKSLFATLARENDLIRRGETVEQPIRISAAWWDIEHSHGPFVFNRKSLTDICPMCEAGNGSKTYLKGQLDHFAATRVPVNPRTSLAMEEKSMAITRKEDAASIIEEELAEELEAKSQPVTKSAALVSKAKPKPKFSDNDEADENQDIDEAEKEAEDEEKGKDRKGKVPPQFAKKAAVLGGATTLANAYAHLEAQPQKSLSRFNVVQLVRRNIANISSEDRRHLALNYLLDELDNELSEVKTAVEEVYLLQPAVEIEDETEQPTMEFLDKFSDDVSTALTSKEPLEQRAGAVQKALNEVSMALRAALTTPANPNDQAEVIAIAVQRAMTPFVDQLAQLTARQQMPTHQPVIQVPVQRSITAPVINQQPIQPQLPISPITGQPSALTAQIRQGMGLQ